MEKRVVSDKDLDTLIVFAGKTEMIGAGKGVNMTPELKNKFRDAYMKKFEKLVFGHIPTFLKKGVFISGNELSGILLSSGIVSKPENASLLTYALGGKVLSYSSGKKIEINRLDGTENASYFISRG